MLLLGVLQAQAAGAAPVANPSFDLLETQVLASTQTSVTFSSLSTYAADYQHLQVRISARTARSAATSSLLMRFNGDAATNYAWHVLRGDGSTIYSSSTTSTTSIRMFTLGNTATASVFDGHVIDLLDPFSESKNTTIRALSAQDPYNVNLTSGVWINTSALSSISFQELISSNLLVGCRFSLYGIKAGA